MAIIGEPQVSEAVVFLDKALRDIYVLKLQVYSIQPNRTKHKYIYTS